MRIALFTLGGTIAMAGRDAAGVVARLGGAAFLPPVPDGVEVEIRDVSTLPSAALTFDAVLDLLALAREEVAGGAAGVIITQGTDTLEETAFLLDSLWTADEPVVVTGAMRNPSLPGADGPANLAAAVAVATAPSARGRGVLVVFGDEIHAARHVRKTHSSSPGTFRSENLGPIGLLVEGVPRFLAAIAPRPSLPPVDGARLARLAVPLYTAVLDDSPEVVARIVADCDGLVVAGYGVGHVSPDLAGILGQLATSVPVVLTTRTGAGSVYARTYGAVGGELDLLGRGLISGGFLHPYKARVLLRLLLAAGADRAAITAAFADFH